MDSIAQIVAAHVNEGGSPEALIGRLVDREESAADHLRLAAIQFGLFPEIVAEVLAEAGLGAPLTAEHRALIRSNFVALMERLRVEHERGDHDH